MIVAIILFVQVFLIIMTNIIQLFFRLEFERRCVSDVCRSSKNVFL